MIQTARENSSLSDSVIDESLIRLRESELRWKLALEGTNYGVWEMDFEKNTGFISDNTKKQLGYSEEEGASTVQFWYTVVHPDDIDRAKQDFYKALKGETEMLEGEYRIVSKAGETKWMHLKGSIVKRNKEGRTLRMVGIHEDITDKVEHQSLLNKANQRWQFAVEGSGYGFWEYNLRTKEAFVSEEGEKILEYKSSQNFNVDQFLKSIHPDDIPSVMEVFNKLMAGKLDHYESIFRLKSKDNNRWKWILEKGLVSTRMPDGSPESFLGITTDITHLKEAEQELTRSKERFRYAAKSASDIIWELDFENKFFLVTEGHEKIFGVNEKVNWQTGLVANYIVEKDRERVRKNFAVARHNPMVEKWEMDYQIKTYSGQILDVSNRAWFMRDKNGKVISAIGAMQDVTEKKNLEKSLRQQQHLSQTMLTKTAIKAQEKERSEIGRELHDNINQLLASSKLWLDFIKDHGDPDNQLILKCISNISMAIDENRKLSHRLVAPELKDTRLIDFIKQTVADISKYTGIEFSFRTRDFKEEKLNQEQRLTIYRIIQEQTTNITRYSKATTASITLSTKKKIFSLVISDDGVGMPKKKRTFGIGLKNIAGRLSLLDGQMRIETDKGKGFTLVVEFPCTKMDQEKSGAKIYT
jgi:PAS domain S-box-containing protein